MKDTFTGVDFEDENERIECKGKEYKINNFEKLLLKVEETLNSEVIEENVRTELIRTSLFYVLFKTSNINWGRE